MPKGSVTVSVLALGNWGTALANYLALRGNKVLGWSANESIVKSINTDHRNEAYLSAVALDPKFSATIDLEEALTSSYVMMVFPSSSLEAMMPKLKLKTGSILISAIKGFEERTVKTPLQFAESVLGDSISYGILSGPSFAKDIVLGKPAGVVAASKDLKVADKIASLFGGGSLKVYTSDDPIGVEIGGAVKNVIALAVGVSDGLGLGDSARAGLITRGLAEMTRLGEAMGADPRTLSGLSGLGDLVMTATCDASRNRTVGLRLGKGEKLSEILRSVDSAVEGVHTTPLVMELARRHKVEMPITEQMSKLLIGDTSPLDAVKALVSRPTRRE